VTPPVVDGIVYQGTIAGEFSGWNGNTLVEVDNGNIWKQIVYYYEYSYSYRPKITIYQEETRYYAEVEGTSERVEVIIIPQYFKGTIKGAFNGWDGNTIIEFTNGALFQQDDDQVVSNFAFQPDIIVYQEGDSWYAAIEGVDKHVKVKLDVDFPAPDPVSPILPIPTPTYPSESRIVNDYRGWDGDTLIELSDGTLWVQDGYYYHYHYAYRPKVTITQEGSSVYALVEGESRAVKIKQVEKIYEGRIVSSFDGWSDRDTTIELSDGSVWQQNESHRERHIGASPTVIIYKDGSLYYAVVDDLDPVNVKKIQ
jgi:(2Fe-2S) ferredoxin